MVSMTITQLVLHTIVSYCVGQPNTTECALEFGKCVDTQIEYLSEQCDDKQSVEFTALRNCAGEKGIKIRVDYKK